MSPTFLSLLDFAVAVLYFLIAAINAIHGYPLWGINALALVR